MMKLYKKYYVIWVMVGIVSLFVGTLAIILATPYLLLIGKGNEIIDFYSGIKTLTYKGWKQYIAYRNIK